MHPYNKEYPYLYIDSSSKLDELCHGFLQCKHITIDTEFVRTQTLKPILGLIQVFDGKQVSLIDPIAIKELSSLAKVLIEPKLLKIVHSCSEDLEALWHHLDIMPAPVFDTQFAAGLLDIGVSIGYANLIEKLFDIKIDKGESRTDWTQRPLTESQCKYASADVTHLLAIYEHLYPKIEEKKQTAWCFDEIAQLAAKKSTILPSEYAYLHLKNNWKLNQHKLAALQKLAQWRLNTARTENSAVNFVLKEVALFEIASKLPQTKQALFDCQHLYSKQARLHGNTIISICKEARSLAPQDCPPKVERLIDFNGYKSCSADLKAIADELAEQYQIPVSLLASKKQINQVLKWAWFTLDDTETSKLVPDLLKGWRATLFSPFLSKESSFYQRLEQNHEIKRSLQILA